MKRDDWGHSSPDWAVEERARSERRNRPRRPRLVVVRQPHSLRGQGVRFENFRAKKPYNDDEDTGGGGDRRPRGGGGHSRRPDEAADDGLLVVLIVVYAMVV